MSKTLRFALPAATVVAALWAGWSLTTREAASAETRANSAAPFDHEHAAWTAILNRYVRDGVVDYAGLQRSERKELSLYLRSLESVSWKQFTTWTRSQTLAFWINAYNAYTVQLILDNFPLKSVRSIGLLPGAAFRKEFISLKFFRQDKISLNTIEHDVLRVNYHEPRIHFAIVCASKSCPALRSEAYRASELDAQLDDAARRFFADTSKNRFDKKARTLYLSSILDWFRSDFTPNAEALPAFVMGYVEPEFATELRKGVSQVKFLDYDWSLNGR